MFEGKNKLIPKANSIVNIEIFISPSDPLHTLESHSPLQEVVLQKQVFIHVCLDVDERKNMHGVWVVSNGTSNIFWVGKPKKQNVLMRTFLWCQGKRRPPTEGGWKNQKNSAFQICFCVYGSFPTTNGSKLTIGTQKSDKVNKATVMSALWLYRCVLKVS